MAILDYNAKLAERIDMGPELSIFRVVPDGWALPNFAPGQFATLGLLGSAPRCTSSLPEKKESVPDKLIRRAYSIASSPLNKDYLEFYVVMVKEGILTPRLWSLKVGDPLFLGQKITGQFIMDSVPESANVIFIGTGTGIAPFISMTTTYFKPDQKRRFSIFHGVRVSQDLTYRGELASLSRMSPNFSYFPIISRPHLDPIQWHGLAGHVQKIWESGAIETNWGFKPTPDNTHFFLCGSPQMIDQMLLLLSKDGFKEHTKKEAGQIHIERYW